MQKQAKKICAFLLSLAMLIGQFAIPTKAANTFELDFLRPTAGITSVNGNFSVAMSTADMSSFYTVDNIRYYMTADSKGENWKVNTSKTDASNLVQGTDTGNVTRLFPSDADTDYFTVYNNNKPFVLSFTAPEEGYYTITADAQLHEKGGYAAVYVNDQYVGKFDTYLEKGENAQPLLTVYLKEGEFANTIETRPIGKSGGQYRNIFVRGYHFTGALSVDKLIGMDASVENNNLYIGRTEQITVKGITSNDTDYDFAGANDTLTYTSSNTEVATVSSSGAIKAVSAGETTITVSSAKTGFTDTIEISVRNATYDHVDFNITEGQIFNLSGVVDLVATPYLNDGTTIEPSDCTITFSSSNSAVASIEGNVMTLNKVGSAKITASVKFKPTGVTKTVSRNITVNNINLTSITAKTEKPVVQLLDKNGVQLQITGYTNGTEIGELSATGFTATDFKYEALTPSIITVDANGICKFVSRGVGKVKVTLIANEAVSCEAEVVAGSAKTTGTLFTNEMIAQARSNAKNFSWAKTLYNTAIKNADKYGQSLDKIYDLIPQEGVPRSTTASTLNATYELLNCCPYCNTNLTESSAVWQTDPINYPWKIQCTACGNRFPSNDFALLYERGLDENGNYDVKRAYANNAAAVSRGEKDALANELYPEKGSGWMVDDGFGWSPSAGTYGTKDANKWAPIALYHHLFWYNADKYDLSYIMNKFRDAYIWSGDAKYGRMGAILLDRIADVYADYDVTKVSLGYSLSHGGGYSGKILGGIWEYYLGELFVEYYDVFYPMYDDPEVINYLSAKAKKLGLDNPKTSAELIRENVENNLVRAVRDALYNADIYGNFGMVQIVAAKTAAAMDTQPETNELLDWLYAPSSVKKETVTDPIYGRNYSSRCYNSGGELGTKYVTDIDRDGFGAEVGITYNRIWLENSVETADVLARYSEKYNLYNNPKFVKMFDTFPKMTLGDGYSLQVGDSGSTAHAGITSFALQTLMGYNILRDPKLAQNYDFYVNGDYTNKYINIYSDPTTLINGIKSDVAKYGKLKLTSENLTGYGLAVLRGGDNGKSYETRYDTWMYYGRTNASHAHADMLAMGIDAYGFNMMPDLGYPEDTSRTANRHEWVRNTIAHNTVTVNGLTQTGIHTGVPYHFDSTDYVKVMDVEADGLYADTSIYRRTLVTIAANEDVSYTLDFFRVKGGNSHMYSFHSQAYSDYAKKDIAYTTSDITFTAQKDSKGNYVGTYAGADVPYGPDPYSTDTNYATNPMYTRGYTWLEEVNRGTDKSGDGVFSINFKQTDFRGQVEDSTGLNLKFWGVNSFKPDSIDIVTGYPPRKASNAAVPGLNYMFIQRTGTNLDTLFTSVLEPYKTTSYIKSVTPITATVKSGNESANDVSKVVKVLHKSGRIDYVVYATNNAVTYTIKDGNTTFDFKGFVGVYTVDASGKNIFRYGNDCTIIGSTSGRGAYSGNVADYTKELALENQITVAMKQSVTDLSVLEGKYVYVNNTGTSKNNGAFRIEKAEQSGENIILRLGGTSVIDGYVNPDDINSGYTYIIAEGQSLRIPVSLIYGAPF